MTIGYGTLPAVGEVFEVRYPFVRSTFRDIDASDETGLNEIQRPTWKPGTEYRGTDGENVYTQADAEGSMVLTVISTHRPPGFPTRVFFTRRFVNPDGKEFGKRKLHIVTAEKFRRLASGYQHEYDLVPQPAVERGA